ncbi:MAG: DNA repair protein RecN [Deltaproteobacteria bacterium]|nr:DNA repair protein RecN [Deltaproteobacteria bacterium]MBP7285569.1 DNA repair protein RecN [Nannocystaceae bacterium]
MLLHLRIRGLALLEDVALDLVPGLNVLTGETGAGKSIIVGALSLVRGARGRVELVREGGDSAEVDAQFDLDAAQVERVRAVLERHGHSPEVDGEDGLLVHRAITRAGRSRAAVAGGLVTQAVLAEVGEELVDICSQHEHHFLTHATRHLEVLDAWAKLGGELAEHHGRYHAWQQSRRALHELQERAATRERHLDYLRFAVDELDAVAPDLDEYEALSRRVTLLRNAQRWAEFAREAHATLYDADDAVAGRLASLLDRAKGGRDDSNHLGLIEEQLAVAQIACEEAARAAARFADELEVEPGELEAADDRLHELERLRRKHGVGIGELADKLAQMRAELEQLEHADEHLRALGDRTDELLAAANQSAQRLHVARTEAATGLAAAIEQELAALHIPKARMQVQIERDAEPGPDGFDRVEFLFSANPGEPLAPLRKVASGGELSRVLLALKGALAAEDRIATYVFDEVDAGVGGAVAESIGRRLQRAAAHHQVLCVTHLPQIAAFADAHFRVGKLQRKGRTITEVARLDDQERVEEIARMLGGAKVTQSARDHAAELVASARTDKGRGAKRSGAAKRSETATRTATPADKPKAKAKRDTARRSAG